MKEYNGRAIASMVLGIVSVVGGFFGIGAIVGLACGIVAIIFSGKGRKSEKKGMGTAGLVLGIIGTVLSGIIFLCAACAFCVVGTTADALVNAADSFTVTY